MPSLSSTSPLDKLIKHTMMTDIFHMVGGIQSAREAAHCALQVGYTAENKELGDQRKTYKGRNVNNLTDMDLSDLPLEDIETVHHAVHLR